MISSAEPTNRQERPRRGRHRQLAQRQAATFTVKKDAGGAEAGVE